MDFAIAFNKVAHNRLLYKLSTYGIEGNSLGWIGSFLCEDPRKLSLKINLLRLFWCFQASHRAFVNDLPEYVSNSTAQLFADDTLRYLTIYNISDCIQEDLNNLES